jgi:4-amino-4-deoxy-L-arabinose transferase-like glycosyltransferase
MSRLLLLLTLLLAFALRVHDLGSQSLWYDEAVTAQVAQQGLAEMARWTADDIQPPLYYAITANWVQFAGVSEWALRFPSVFFGALMVVLAYALGRRLFGPVAGGLAALLAALHPLWIYYSQEARMYTLLTALGMVAGYALLRVLAAGHSHAGYPKSRLSWWIAFGVAAIGLLYTHYFAVFLLAAFALYFLLSLLTRRDLSRRRLLVEGAAAGLLVILAYLPWLPNALRRFGEDASYWQGALKLDEALRHIAISFSTGETVLEQQAIPLAWAVAALALLCLAALLWASLRPPRSSFTQSRRVGGPEWIVHRSSILFVLLYLLTPIAAILLLSTGNPKFNPRYLMLASPGLVLLLAGGLALPFRPSLPINRSPFTINHFSRLLSLLSLLSFLAIFAFSIRNWFADPAFTKDDWRGAVTYVKSQLQPDERVILLSGHAYPAWRYYAPDIEALRLPAIETLDVNAVLDLSAAGALNQDLAGRRGAWLVQWQDEVLDPNGVVPFLLDTAGDAQPVAASFWGLGSPQHYRFFDAVRSSPDRPGTAFPEELPLSAAYQGQQLNINFANQVELLGYSQPHCPEPLCPVYLFWQSNAPLAADLKLTATLFDRYQPVAASQPLDRRLAAYEYPTFRWQPGQVVLSKLDIPAALGTPPGEYRLRLGVYDADSGQPLDVLDAAGAAQGQWAWLDPVIANDLVVDGPGGPPPDSQPVGVAPEITLQGLTADRSEAEPGDVIGVEAWWQANAQPGQDYKVGYQWLDRAGQVRSGGWLAPAGAAFPTSRWPAGPLVRGQLRFWAPSNGQPGPWTLRFGLQNAGIEDPTTGFAGETVDLPVAVLPSTRRFEPSGPFDFPSDASFDSLVQLLGARVATPLQAGAVVPVTVGWTALQPMETSFTGFVHLLDQEGRIVAQDDHVPLHGQRPTTTWVGGEVVEDGYELRLPADLPAGAYWLAVGLYDASRPGLPRLGAPALLGPLTVATD